MTAGLQRQAPADRAQVALTPPGPASHSPARRPAPHRRAAYPLRNLLKASANAFENAPPDGFGG
jgi:hypothetical protein